MNLRSKRALAAASAGLVVAAGAGGALAAGGKGAHRAGDRANPAAIATYLGLTRMELRTQLEGGKSLAQIATAQGKSVSGLEDAIYDAAKARFDKGVAAGRLTSAQEQARLDRLKAHLGDFVNRTGVHLGRAARGRAVGAAAASYLGLTRAELRTELKSGKSLAQVATDKGKSVDGLKAAILAAAKTRLDRGVTGGRLTATQEQKLLDGLKARIDKIVARTRSADKA